MASGPEAHPERPAGRGPLTTTATVLAVTLDELAVLMTGPDDHLSPLQQFLADLPTWHRHAACAGSDESFFPELGQSAQGAKRVCAGCPVKVQCLDFAVAAVIDHGVWGGQTPQERRRARRTAAAA